MLKAGWNLRDDAICGQEKNWRVAEEKRLPTKLAKMAVNLWIFENAYEIKRTLFKRVLFNTGINGYIIEIFIIKRVNDLHIQSKIHIYFHFTKWQLA